MTTPALTLEQLASALLWLESGCGGVLSLNDGTTYDLDPESIIEAAVENGWRDAAAEALGKEKP